ncbi:retrovirus-related pol polyprotein from transposon TNT 1-94 [Tanacetum coccineum]
MDVKMTFLNGELREVVYVSQPEGFIDQDNANHVYRLKKALYGPKQPPRAWYDMPSSFLLSQEFSKVVVDPTLFTRNAGTDILLVQIYVDDIIFASTNPAMYDEFANIMTSKFRMSMMGKMSDPVDTPIVEKSKLNKDLQGKPVDPTHYRGSKHIDVRFHFIKEQVEKWSCGTILRQNRVSASRHLQKALPRERFHFLINKLGMQSMSPETLQSLAREDEELLRAGILILMRLEESLESTQERIYGSWEAMEDSKRRRSMLDYRIQQLSKSSSEGSDIIPEENKTEENKVDAEVAEKQAGNVQTSLTLSSAKLEIQLMVDVPIHQEDPTVQRTPLIDTVILLVIEKTTSTPTPPITQAQVQMCSTSCWKDSSREAWNALFVQGNLRWTTC